MIPATVPLFGFPDFSSPVKDEDTWFLDGVFAVFLVLLICCALVIVVLFAVRNATNAARFLKSKRTKPLRLLLMDYALDDGPADIDALFGSRYRARLSQELGFAMIAKLSGPSKDKIVQLLVDNGSVTTARKMARSWRVSVKCAGLYRLGLLQHHPSLDIISSALSSPSLAVRRVALDACSFFGADAPLDKMADVALSHSALRRDFLAALSVSGKQVGAAVADLLSAQLDKVSAASAFDAPVSWAKVLLLSDAVGVAPVSSSGPVLAKAWEVFSLLQTSIPRSPLETSTLRSALASDPIDNVLAAVTRSVGRAGDVRFTHLVFAAAQHSSTSVRYQAAVALGRLGVPQGAPILASLTEDSDLLTARAAAESLLRCGPRGRNLLAMLDTPAAAEVRALPYVRQQLVKDPKVAEVAPSFVPQSAAPPVYVRAPVVLSKPWLLLRAVTNVVAAVVFVAAVVLMAVGWWSGPVVLGFLADSWLFVLSTVAVYTIAINVSYLILVSAAFSDLGRYRSRVEFANYDEWFRDPNTQGVSVLVPAHNESAGILSTISAMTGMHYPDYELVIIDDGSKDDTADLVIASLDMVQVPLLATYSLPTKAKVNSTWMAQKGNLSVTLVRTSGGGKADALNVGTNYSRKELVCCVDADSLLEPSALLHVARPFAESPDTVATGGVIRVANGGKIEAGRVTEPKVPFSLLPVLQIVEYLRAFFIGREGWSRLGGMIIISGAFGVFRSSALVAAGGYATDCIGEDAELVVRMHRKLYEAGLDGKQVVMVPEPVAWTEVPTSLRVLSRQRRRWHRGLADVFARHKKMVGNPKYGRVGLLSLPWFFLFELIAPAVELAGYAYLLLLAITAGVVFAADSDGLEQGLNQWGLGQLNIEVALLLSATALLFSAFISLLSMLAEELTFARYRTNRDLVLLLAGLLLETFGFRQLSAVWRLRGLLDGLRNKVTVWGEMERAGFGDAKAEEAKLLLADSRK